MGYSIVAVGGSGKQMATVVGWLANLGLVEQPLRILVADPDQTEVMGPLGKASLDVPDASLRPVPAAIGAAGQHVTLKSVFRDTRPQDVLGRECLSLLFDQDLCEAKIDEQFYANPAAAATAFSWCAGEKMDAALTKCLNSGDVVVVGSLFGGTGAGIFPRLLSRLSQLREPNSPHHISYVALTQWFALEPFGKTESEAEIPTPEKLASNWKMGAKFLLEDLAHSRDGADIGWIIGPVGQDAAAGPLPTRSKGAGVTASPLLLLAGWLFSVGYARGRNAFGEQKEEALWKQADAGIRGKVFALTVDTQEGAPVIRNLKFNSASNAVALSWNKLYALSRARIEVLKFVFEAFLADGYLDQERLDLWGTTQLLGKELVRFWRSLQSEAKGALRKAVLERVVTEASPRADMQGSVLQFSQFLGDICKAFPSIAPGVETERYPALAAACGGIEALSRTFTGVFSSVPAEVAHDCQRGKPQLFVEYFFGRLTDNLLQVGQDALPKADKTGRLSWVDEVGNPTFLLPGKQPGGGVPNAFSNRLLSSPLSGPESPVAWDSWSQLGDPRPYSMPTPVSHALTFAHRVKYYLDECARDAKAVAALPEQGAVKSDWRTIKALWLGLLGGELSIRNMGLREEEDPHSLVHILKMFEEGRAFGSDLPTTDEGVVYPGGWISLIVRPATDGKSGQVVGAVFPFIGPCPTPTWRPQSSWVAPDASWAVLRSNIDHLKARYGIDCQTSELLWARALPKIDEERPKGPDGKALVDAGAVPTGDLSFVPQTWLNARKTGSPLPFFLLQKKVGFASHLDKMLSGLTAKTPSVSAQRPAEGSPVLDIMQDKTLVARIHGLGSPQGPGVVELLNSRPLSAIKTDGKSATENLTSYLTQTGSKDFRFAGLKAAGSERHLFSDWSWLAGGSAADTVDAYLRRSTPFLDKVSGSFCILVGNQQLTIRLQGLFCGAGKWFLVAPPVGALPEDRKLEILKADGSGADSVLTAKVSPDGTVTIGAIPRKWKPVVDVGGTVLNCGETPESCCCNGNPGDLWAYRTLIILRDGIQQTLVPFTPMTKQYAISLGAVVQKEPEVSRSSVTYTLAFPHGLSRRVSYKPSGKEDTPTESGICREIQANCVSWFPSHVQHSATVTPLSRLFVDLATKDLELADSLSILGADSDGQAHWHKLPDKRVVVSRGGKILAFALDDSHGRGGLFAVHWDFAGAEAARPAADDRKVHIAIDLGTHSTKIQYLDGENPVSLELAKGWRYALGNGEILRLNQNDFSALSYHESSGRTLTGICISSSAIEVPRGPGDPYKTRIATLPGLGFRANGVKPGRYEYWCNFKWKGSDFSSKDGERFRDALFLYVDTLLLEIYAALLQPSQMVVHYSYPGAFDDRWFRQYCEIWEKAVRQFNSRFGDRNVVTLRAAGEKAQVPDESNAALYSNGIWGRDGLLVSADLGGGTLDMAAACSYSDESGRRRLREFHRDSWIIGGQLLEWMTYSIRGWSSERNDVVEWWARPQQDRLRDRTGADQVLFQDFVSQWSNGTDVVLTDESDRAQMLVEILGYFTLCAEAISRFGAGYVAQHASVGKGPLVVNLALFGLGFKLADVLDHAMTYSIDCTGKSLSTGRKEGVIGRLVLFIEARMRELLGANMLVTVNAIPLRDEQRAGVIASGLLRRELLGLSAAVEPGICAVNGFIDAYSNPRHAGRVVDWKDVVGGRGRTLPADTIVFQFSPPVKRSIAGEAFPSSPRNPTDWNVVVERWGLLMAETTEYLQGLGGDYAPELATGGPDCPRKTTALSDFLKALVRHWTPNAQTAGQP